jgi:hypothetical protein
MLMDAKTISYILETYNPYPANATPLLVEPADNHGFGMRLAAYAGMRFLNIIPNVASMKWWNTHWLNTLFKDKYIDLDHVCTYENLLSININIIFRYQSLLNLNTLCWLLHNLPTSTLEFLHLMFWLINMKNCTMKLLLR